MSDTTTSPNMSMPVPNVSVAPGPDWAKDLNACLSIIDSHTHTTGQGVLITPAALNLNTDVTLQGNDLTTTRSVRFDAQGSPLSAPSDLGCIYESGVDLYYNDGSGNQIRLTQSGAVAGATGTITGLPSGTASASFSGSTFTFQSATNTPANMNVGPVKIGRNVVNPFGVTIAAAGSQAADFNMTLPVALPTVPSFVTSDSSGNLGFQSVVSNSILSTTNANATQTTTDGVTQYYFSTGASDRTFTLAAASSSSGRRFTVKKTDSGAGKVVITRAGGDTIDGAATYSLYFQNEGVIIECDGASWYIIGSCSGGFVAFTPSQTLTTNATATGQVRKTFDSIDIDLTVSWSGATSAATFTLTLPAGLTINTTKLTTTSGVVPLGTATYFDDSASIGYNLFAVYNSTTAVRLNALTSPGGVVRFAGEFSNTSIATIAANDFINVIIRGLPVVTT